MAKFKTEIRKCLRSMAVRELNAGHNQLDKRLNFGCVKIQAKLNEDKRKKTSTDSTVTEGVLVVGAGNYNSLTKTKCLTAMEH